MDQVRFIFYTFFLEKQSDLIQFFPFQSKWIRTRFYIHMIWTSDSFGLKWNELDQVGLIFYTFCLKNQSHLIQFIPFQSKWIRTRLYIRIIWTSDSFILKWNELDQIGLIFYTFFFKNQSYLIQLILFQF